MAPVQVKLALAGVDRELSGEVGRAGRERRARAGDEDVGKYEVVRNDLASAGEDRIGHPVGTARHGQRPRQHQGVHRDLADVLGEAALDREGSRPGVGDVASYADLFEQPHDGRVAGEVHAASAGDAQILEMVLRRARRVELHRLRHTAIEHGTVRAAGYERVIAARLNEAAAHGQHASGQRRANAREARVASHVQASGSHHQAAVAGGEKDSVHLDGAERAATGRMESPVTVVAERTRSRSGGHGEPSGQHRPLTHRRRLSPGRHRWRPRRRSGCWNSD